MICEYCNNEFKTDKSLYNHQKRTKYCLKKQNKYIICCGCEKSFSKDNYKIHILNCVQYLQNKVEELQTENRDIIYFQNENDNLKQKIIDIEKDKRDQINSLQKQIKSLQDEILNINKTAMMKPTTTNNTTINNKILNMSVLNFDDNNVKRVIDNKYNADVIAGGQKGIAKFATNYLLTDSHGNLNYVCTDVSRKIFKFKNGFGELEKDVNAKKLTNILSENGLFEMTTNLSQQFWTNEDGSIDQDKFLSIVEKASEIKNIKDDNTIFKNELANMTSV